MSRVYPVQVLNAESQVGSGAASGIDIDSDTLIELSEHPNCFGAKVRLASSGRSYPS